MTATLERIGFTADELHECDSLDDGRIAVKSTIAAEPALLLLDTARADDVELELAYVRYRGLDYTRDNPNWGKALVTELTALGKERGPGAVDVYGSEEEVHRHTTAGRLGTGFVDGAIIAIDPVEWRVARSLREEPRASFSRASHRIGMLRSIRDNLPLVDALRDPRDTDARPIFVANPARSSSTLSIEYVERHRSWWGRRDAARRIGRQKADLDTTWLMPGGAKVRLDMRVTKPAAAWWLSQLGVDHVDGNLGADFLYQWLPVFDFARRELVLFDLGMD